MKKNILLFISISVLLCLGVFLYSYFSVREYFYTDGKVINATNITKQNDEKQLASTNHEVSDINDSGILKEDMADDSIEEEQDIKSEYIASKDFMEENLLNNSNVNFEYLNELGNIYKDEGNLYKFKIICDSIINKHPDALDVYVDIARFFLENMDSDYATSIFEYGIAMNPNDIRFRYCFGDILEIKGDYDSALNQYNKALEFKVDDAEGLYKTGEIYLKLGNQELADTYFIQASQFSPKYVQLSQESKDYWLNM